jgi:hypothetical protein
MLTIVTKQENCPINDIGQRKIQGFSDISANGKQEQNRVEL